MRACLKQTVLDTLFQRKIPDRLSKKPDRIWRKNVLDVCLLGTGGMMPLPGRRLTALMTRYNGSSLLIDCGEGTQVAIKEKGWTFKPIDAICFTHYHADHISGLPGLLLTMGNTDRREPLTMIGPKGLERVVNSLRVICPELPFPIVFHEVTAPEEVIEMNGYKITEYLEGARVCDAENEEDLHSLPRAAQYHLLRLFAGDLPQGKIRCGAR
jgi:ribonuclease BN (tRNA processing enzyme)